jgi:transcriptional regulator with XRE-family HTH domain
MAFVKLQIGARYIDDLAARMDKAQISQGALAREMGMDPTHVSRWFTKNPNRQVSPTMETVERIEVAMADLKGRKRV